MSPLPQAFRKTEFTHRRGLAADRPPANEVLIGTLYFSTDLGLLERSNGTSWQSFASAGGGGGGGPITETVLTADDETATLVNSRQLVAGSNISLDNSVAGELTVNGVPSAPLIHAPSHLSAGADPVDVKLLAGFPGGGTTFLRDDGTFAAPPVPVSGLVLLEQKTAAASASLNFTNFNPSLYDEYLFEVVGLVPVTNNVDLWMRMSSDGGATYISSNIYFFSCFVWNNSGTAVAGVPAGSLTSAIKIRNSAEIPNDAAQGVSGLVRFFSPQSTVKAKYLQYRMSYYVVPVAQNLDGTGVYNSITAINGLQFLFSSGNISTGTIRMYGVDKIGGSSGSGGGAPTAHHTSHEPGGSDQVTLAESQITGLVTDLAAKAPLVHQANHQIGGSDALVNNAWTNQANIFAQVQEAPGIKFPAIQVVSPNVNTLDDYEEGTFTPIDTSGAGLVFAYGAGDYTKIGNKVFFNLQVVYPTTSNTNEARIGGLPFVNNGGNAAITIGLAVFPSGGFIFTAFAINTTTDLRFFDFPGGAVAVTNVRISGINVILGGNYTV